MIAFSWSRLEVFEQCPRKFQLKYITKEMPKQDFDKPHFIKGHAIHKTLEDYIQKGIWPDPILFEGNSFENNLDFLLPMLDKIRQAPEAHAELEWCFDIELNELSWFSKKAWCRVILDVIVIIGDVAIIIDWKSGKVKKYSDQLKLCAGAVMTRYPQVKRVVSAYVWCDHPTASPTWVEYTRDDLENIWQEFGERAEMIQMANESGQWLARRNQFCGWCDALPHQCEYK